MPQSFAANALIPIMKQTMHVPFAPPTSLNAAVAPAMALLSLAPNVRIPSFLKQINALTA